MTRRYNPGDPSDRDALNHYLNAFGIHFETDLFNQTYVLIDHHILRSVSSSGGRPPRITDDIRYQAYQMKCDGMTVREIAAALSISIGSVSSFTKQFGDLFNEQ